MPPRRRPGPTVAASLPASRLPLGTPALPSQPAPPHAACAAKAELDTSNRSPDRAASNSREKPPLTHSTSTEDQKHTMSLADLKLDRQRKKYEAAEAPITAGPAPLEKRQTSRTKGKWKPFDYTNEGGGVPVETRVNTYSRASSLSRPVSSHSHRTDGSGRSESSSFQLFTGRKGRRHQTDLRAYGSEKQQTTVEASFDEREIYEVFGNALPGLEFLDSTLGSKDGQLQFLQHPNGDISAQQWSADRFAWVNIGQFSNIRKKLEGQLAFDRLKGEMGHHTLQQNTLRYFRTIAKQREALVMGLPFGPRDVEAALPVPPLTYIAKPEKDAKTAEPSVSTTSATNRSSKPQDAPKNKPTDIAAPQPRSPLPPNVPKEPMAERWEVSEVSEPFARVKASDPFYLPATNTPPSYSAHTTNMSSSYTAPSYQNRMQYSSAAPTNYAYSNVNHTPYRMPHAYQFPPVAVPNQTMQSPGAQKYFADRAAMADRMQAQLRQVYGNQPYSYGQSNSYGQSMPSYRASVQENYHVPHETKPFEVSSDREIVAPQPKSISSVDRSAMRHALYKIGETAKERNLSQANIRTVLHDPFQSPSVAEQQSQTADVVMTTAKDAESPLFTRSASGKQLMQQSSPLPPAREQRKDILQESSPDTQWTKRPYEHSTPLPAKSSVPQTESQPLVRTTSEQYGSDKEAERAEARRVYDEQLNAWWTNGSTFARQEDLFQAIVAAQAADSKLHSPPAHLTPIGPPSRNGQPAEAPFNKTTTRLLIPVWENLAAYVDGPPEKRRDYWCRWGAAPEWAIDRSPDGNKSFFEADWGSPPQRVGRDSRYSDGVGFGGHTSGSARESRWQGVDQRFAYAGRY